ncbi:cytochrome [Mycobacterium kansasii]|nr:cytochrome [Mycobacterium kansasii]
MVRIHADAYDSVDYFSDESLLPNPYPYFDHLRAKSPVLRLPPHQVMAITGYPEGNAVYRDSGNFSSLVAVGGPFPPLPFEPRGDDIGELIERHRHRMPMSNYLTTMDPPQHSRARALLGRLLTAERLACAAESMRRLAGELIDQFIATGRCEFVSEYAKPFSFRVIADLLGVPGQDRRLFDVPRPPVPVGALDHAPLPENPLRWLDDIFVGYLVERRREPRADVLTQLATARYPDGTTPEAADIARSATLLFTAGRGATAFMLSWSVRLLAERPDLAEQLRADRSAIPRFVEEVLRMESPVKSDFRLARKTTRVGEVVIPAGTTVMLCPGAINRDPRKFAAPNEFRLNRSNARDHMAFGRGAHSCPGASLARVEARISIECILERLTEIRLNSAEHGATDDRRFSYEPAYTLRALTGLHLEFAPALPQPPNSAEM